MSEDLDFKLIQVDQKPAQRKYRRGGGGGGHPSRWKPVIDTFLASGENCVEVTVEGYTGRKLKAALDDRVTVRNLEGVMEVWRDKDWKVYLERLPRKPTKLQRIRTLVETNITSSTPAYVPLAELMKILNDRDTWEEMKDEFF